MSTDQKSVLVLRYDHRHGTDVFVFRTHSSAETRIFELIKDSIDELDQDDQNKQRVAVLQALAKEDLSQREWPEGTGDTMTNRTYTPGRGRRARGGGVRARGGV